MYIPDHYRENDFDKALQIINGYPFATVVTATGGWPHATHLPVLYREEDGVHFAEFHLPIENPHFQDLKKGAATKIIFKGPDTYISSEWYTVPEVSTWNYQAVHLYGHPEMLDGKMLLPHLIRLTRTFESREPDGYELMDRPDDVVYGQLAPIRAFRMKIEKWEAAFKLSQKMDAQSRSNIIAQLRSRNTDADNAIADAMENQVV